MWCVLKEESSQNQVHSNQKVSLFLSWRSSIINYCFFSFVVEEINGKGSASFFLSSRNHFATSIPLFYIATTSQGEENLENQENLGIRTLGFLFVWLSDPKRLILGCDSWDQETLGLRAPEFSFSSKEGVGVKKQISFKTRHPDFFFNIVAIVQGVRPHLPP